MDKIFKVQVMLFVIMFLGAFSSKAQICFSAPDSVVEDNSGLHINRSGDFATADFNNDGKADIITTGDSLYLHLGDGKGKFAAPSKINTGFYSTNIFCADFNNDHNIDVALTNIDATITVLLGKGTGAFKAAVVSPMGTFDKFFGLTGADFNNDGFIDLTSNIHAQNKMIVMMGNGVGGFALPTTTYATALFPFYNSTADLNKDGNMDIFCGSEVSDTVTVFLGNGKGGFTPNYIGKKAPYAFIKSVDINKDGKADLVASNINGDSVTIMHGDGVGGFNTSALYAAGISPKDLSVLDLDADGFLDIATINYGGVSSFSILKGNASGGFNAPIKFKIASANPFSFFMATPDLNNDGKLDLVTTANYLQGFEYFMNCNKVTSLDEITTNVTDDIKIYPNPASDKCTIEIGALQSATVEIIDLQGKILLSQKIQEKQILDITALAKGLYFIRVRAFDKATIKKLEIR